MGSYIDKLKAANPEAYTKLSDLMAYSANEGNKGVAQDWQAQIFTNLDTSQLNAPKNIDVNQYLKAGAEPIYQSDNDSPNGVSISGYKKDLGTVNGLPIQANYDTRGNLTEYAAPNQYRNWLNGQSSVSGRWDASGNANPAQYQSSGGGFFGGFVNDHLSNIADAWSNLPLPAKLAAAYYGGSAIADSLGIGGTTAGLTPEAAAAAEAAGAVPEIGALPVAGPGVEVASLAPEAGLESLTAPATTNAYTAAQEAQDALAMTGNPAANASLTGAAAIGAQNAYPALNAAAAGTAAAAGMTPAQIAAAAGAGAGINAATGSSLASILPYTAGAGLVGAYLQSNAAQNAADTQTAAANQAIAQQQKNFETINAQQAPYRGLGYQGINAIRALLPGNNTIYDEQGKAIGTGIGTDYLTHQFTPEDFAAGIDPGYAFRLNQGQMANQRAANIGGGALSGNTLKGLQDYTQGLASQEYGNAFNRYQTQRQNIYNTLASIAGIGQTGQTATNTAATNATNAATQLGVGSAGAQAAGQVGTANAYGNAINNVTNQYTLASLLNQRGNVALPIA